MTLQYLIRAIGRCKPSSLRALRALDGNPALLRKKTTVKKTTVTQCKQTLRRRLTSHWNRLNRSTRTTSDKTLIVVASSSSSSRNGSTSRGGISHAAMALCFAGTSHTRVSSSNYCKFSYQCNSCMLSDSVRRIRTFNPCTRFLLKNVLKQLLTERDYTLYKL